MTDFSYEDQYDGDVCGLDEVGRGPLAGPVVAACVIIPQTLRQHPDMAAITDSKALSFEKREMLFDLITTECPYAIAVIESDVIDRINILQASLLAMKNAHDEVLARHAMTTALVDGRQCPDIVTPCVPIVKGDLKSKTIAAASIIAKVHRDRIMADLCQTYPAYGWSMNAGYPTAQHRDALMTHGITPHHRKSFAPVRRILESEQAVKIKSLA